MANTALIEQTMLYGLVVESDVTLPGPALTPPKDNPDVKIVRGDLDWTDEKNPPKVDEFFLGRPGEAWFNIPGKIMMRVEAGHSITYQPYPDVSDAEMKAYLFGSGLGALLMQRGNLVLHANAIAMPDRSAIVCFGTSGAGKSTIAAAMMQRGYHVLADDVCPIGPDGLIASGPAQMKLWDDAASLLGIATDTLERIPGDRAKWFVPLERRSTCERHKPELFVLLDPGSTETIAATRLSGSEKFSALRNNIYRPVFNEALGIEPKCLKQIAEIGASTSVIRVSRPQHGVHIKALVDTILELHAAC